jgi:hypothetical protein
MRFFFQKKRRKAPRAGSPVGADIDVPTSKSKGRRPGMAALKAKINFNLAPAAVTKVLANKNNYIHLLPHALKFWPCPHQESVQGDVDERKKKNAELKQLAVAGVYKVFDHKNARFVTLLVRFSNPVAHDCFFESLLFRHNASKRQSTRHAAKILHEGVGEAQGGRGSCHALRVIIVVGRHSFARFQQTRVRVSKCGILATWSLVVHGSVFLRMFLFLVSFAVWRKKQLPPG